MNEYKIALMRTTDIIGFCNWLHEVMPCDVEYSYETINETATGKWIADTVVFYVKTFMPVLAFDSVMKAIGLKDIKGYYM